MAGFAIRRITAVLPHGRQTMCFFATLEASVAHLVTGSMRDPVRLAFGSTLRPSENVRVPHSDGEDASRHRSC
jgi:superfamily II DNA/RNA helicase